MSPGCFRLISWHWRGNIRLNVTTIKKKETQMNGDIEGLRAEVTALKEDFENFKYRQLTMMKPCDRDTIKSGLLTVLCNATGIFRRTITKKDQPKYLISK